MNIPFHKAHITDEEINEVTAALKSGWLTMGPRTVEFENQFAAKLGAKHAVSVNSATAALHLALKAIGIKEGDEVIVPSNTFIATAEVVTYFNAKPVLCDIETGTFNIDVSKIEALITDKTKAIMPVHFAGQPCDMREIAAIAKKHNLKIIEDAAHALPAKYDGKYIGTLSDITCFSFYATKTLCTGEGGMATTTNDEYAKSMKINRLHGISRDAWDRYSAKGSWYYEIVDNGNKYNTTDMNAALGLVQLKKLDWMNEERLKIAAKYDELFKGTKVGITSIKPDRETSRHLYVVQIPERDSIITRMGEAGIKCSVHFIPVYKHPYYKEKFGFKDSDYPVNEEYFSKALSLPIYPEMTDEEIEYVAKTLINLVENV